VRASAKPPALFVWLLIAIGAPAAPAASSVAPGNAPKILLSYPAERATFDRTSIPVIALVIDETGITQVRLTVNGERIADVAAPPDHPARVEVKTSVPLQLGDNVLLIEATNRANRTAELIRVVVRERPNVVRGTPPPSEKRPPGRYAVVIGAGVYDDPRLQRLGSAADTDARRVVDVLVKEGGFAKDDVLLVSDSAQTKPTLANVKRAIGEWLFKKTTRDGTVFVYYAGQVRPTTAEVGTRSYLLLRDTDPTDPDSLFITALDTDDLVTILRRLAPERLTVLLDTCLNRTVDGILVRPSRPPARLEQEIRTWLGARPPRGIHRLPCGSP
jgi:hypothetical protein